MSWLQEKKDKSERDGMTWAYEVVGWNTNVYFVRNMVKALSMMSMLNTPAENERLRAGKAIIKYESKQKKGAK